ncbi:MAG: hypothetical protein GXO79_06955, partial [Chlorobi bacterium]|nr:hypothetical protein [Chlorobiota bacterium]
KIVKSFIFLILFSLLGCNSKLINELKFKYSISGSMSIDNVQVSDIKINFKSTGETQIEKNEGIYIVDTIGNENELWFNFIAKKGEIYKISWQDSWWEEFTAGSIFVTAFEEDRLTEFFPKNRLIQMDGSPKVISIPADGKVFLKVTGYDTEISGTFALNIEKIDLDLVDQISFNESLNYTISAGEVKLLNFDVVKDSLYSVILEGSEFIGAYGDQVEVKVTALRENLNDSYFFEEFVLSPVFAGQPNIQKITALKSEKVYLALVGAYWWEPRDVSITVERN